MTQLPPTAGWYPDAQGQQRWWDGSAWGSAAPASPAYAAPAHVPPGPPPRQKRKLWPWIVGGVVVLVIAIGAAAGSGDKKSHSGNAPQATVGSSTPFITQSGSAAGSTIEVSVNGTTADVSVSKFHKATPDGIADIKGTFYEVTVTVVGKTGAFDINPLFFNARATDGTVIDIALASTSDQIDTTAANPGDKVAGTVGFDVPAGKTIELIQMKTVLGRLLGSWHV